MAHQLEDYSFGRVTVDGEVHTKDLIVHDGGVIPRWWREQGHSLVPSDLDTIIHNNLKTLIVGCGASGQLVVPLSTQEWLQNRGVSVIALPTAEACRRYNEMCSRGGVVAALHLTC